MPTTLVDLRRLAVSQSLFPPTTLQKALKRFGFVQADPIRAPARAQDLILRHRVKNYRAGDLELRYSKLDIEEDFFINYGFVTRAMQALMHPRAEGGASAESFLFWPKVHRRRVQLLLDFVRERGVVHPREVEARFAHGKITNYWGGSSNATTRMLDALHYQGLLRIVRRDGGIRIYAAHAHKPRAHNADLSRASLDALVDVAAGIYAPLPGKSLANLIRRLQYATPQWEDELPGALKRARERLAHGRIHNIDWHWPADEAPARLKPDDSVRLLTPFDPVVWDRHRFELLWGWAYRFEAYTPPAKRKLGYYALPLLWRDQVIGWGNLSVKNGELQSTFGYVRSQPRDRIFKRELEAEIERMRSFLRLS
jgi:uncharacterized protein